LRSILVVIPGWSEAPDPESRGSPDAQSRI
jgi:hypothetical protein